MTFASTPNQVVKLFDKYHHKLDLFEDRKLFGFPRKRQVQNVPRALTNASIFVIVVSIQDLFLVSFLDSSVGQNSLKRRHPFSTANSFRFELSRVETTSCHLFTTMESRYSANKPVSNFS